MNFGSLILVIFTLCLIHLSAALPLKSTTDAFNLHQNLSLHDINDLGGKDKRIKALLDVQTTIDEVEKLLITDPSLPRLTKGEIRDLFEKVTKDELNKSISSGDKEKQEFMKNLILALPYHSDEFIKIENLASHKASTMHPIVEPKVPDELKTLLKQHGLLSDNQNIGLNRLSFLPDSNYPLSSVHEKKSEGNKNIPNVKPESYLSFKHLTVDNKNISTEIGNFLNKYGLFNNGTEQKNLKVKKEKTSSSTIQSSYVPLEYSNVLNDMGMQKPKFDALISSKTAPDPVREFKKVGASKNEIKRQNNNDQPTKVSFESKDKPLLESSLESTDDSDTTTTQSPKTTSSTTETILTTEEEKKNNLEDEIEPIDEPEQLPSPRRSGFYMIFDWNTFLEVGEDPEKIVVRFDPKVGDASRFLPVNIP